MHLHPLSHPLSKTHTYTHAPTTHYLTNNQQFFFAPTTNYQPYTLYGQKYLDTWPPCPYMLVERHIPNLVPLCSYNIHWEGFPLDFGTLLWECLPIQPQEHYWVWALMLGEEVLCTVGIIVWKVFSGVGVRALCRAFFYTNLVWQTMSSWISFCARSTVRLEHVWTC